MQGNRLATLKLGRVRITLFKGWHLEYRHVTLNDYGASFKYLDVGPVRVRITGRAKHEAA